MKTKLICKSKFLVVVSAFALLSSSLFITGCSWDWMPGPEWAMFGDNRVNTSGANQLFEEAFESVDLATLLDPDGKAKASNNEEERVNNALAAFELDHYDKLTRQFRRNAVQERVLAASDQRCNLYKTMLSQSSTRANFILGSATTILAGAGAIVTGGAVNALSASAAATSGIKAEYNQSYFHDLNISVITKGIDVRRKDIYDEIKVRQGDGYELYNVQAAIRHAIKFHGACSMVEGISTAGEKMDTGLDTFLKNHKKFKEAFPQAFEDPAGEG